MSKSSSWRLVVLLGRCAHSCRLRHYMYGDSQHSLNLAQDVHAPAIRNRVICPSPLFRQVPTRCIDIEYHVCRLPIIDATSLRNADLWISCIQRSAKSMEGQLIKTLLAKLCF